MTGRHIIVLSANILVWLIYITSVGVTQEALSYAYVPVGFTAGSLIALLSMGRVALAANAFAWSLVIFLLVGSPGNALMPVTVFTVIAFSLGSFTATISGYSQ